MTPCCGNCCSDRCILYSLRQTHEDVITFGRALACIPQSVFCLFRGIAFLIMAAITGVCFASYMEHGLGYFFIYLTYWTATLEVAFFAVAGYVSFLKYQDEHAELSGCLVNTAWILQYIVYPCSFFVCSLFWLLVYDPSQDLTASSALVHSVNFALVLIDMCLSNTTYRLLHFWIPITYGIIYGTWSVVYDHLPGGVNEGGDDYIYSVLDWDADMTGSLGLFSGVLLSLGFVHFTIYMLMHCTQNRMQIKFIANHEGFSSMEYAH